MFTESHLIPAPLFAAAKIRLHVPYRPYTHNNNTWMPVADDEDD
jgi:hypothetical protein